MFDADIQNVVCITGTDWVVLAQCISQEKLLLSTIELWSMMVQELAACASEQLAWEKGDLVSSHTLKQLEKHLSKPNSQS